jgi:hypothetical protein
MPSLLKSRQNARFIFQKNSKGQENGGHIKMEKDFDEQDYEDKDDNSDEDYGEDDDGDDESNDYDEKSSA